MSVVSSTFFTRVKMSWSPNSSITRSLMEASDVVFNISGSTMPSIAKELHDEHFGFLDFVE